MCLYIVCLVLYNDFVAVNVFTYTVPCLYYTLVINVCHYVYMYTAHLHGIIYAIDHLRPPLLSLLAP